MTTEEKDELRRIILRLEDKDFAQVLAEVSTWIELTFKDSRYKALVLTKLEEAEMFAERYNKRV